MTADRREAAGCLRRTKEDENGKSQATENDVRTSSQLYVLKGTLQDQTPIVHLTQEILYHSQ